MSMNTNQVGTVAVLEVVAGTRVEPLDADSDVISWGEGQPTVNFNNASLGKRNDGTFNDAPVAGGQQTITYPDLMTSLLHSATPDGSVEPKNWKYAKMCGAKVDTSASPILGLMFDGMPSCFTGSIDNKNLECSTKSVLYKSRGCRGNMTIAWDGANAPLIMTAAGLQGALISKEDIAVDDKYTVIGDDTSPFETMGHYILTVGSTVYQATTGEFDAGNSVTFEPANNESGVAQAKITGRDKLLKLTLIQLTEGDTIYDQAKNNDTIDVTIVGDVVAGYDMTFTKCQLLDPSNGDVDGTTAWDIELIVESALFLQKDLS